MSSIAMSACLSCLSSFSWFREKWLYPAWSEDIVDGSAAKNAGESEAMQCSESSGTNANVFSTLEPNSQCLRMKGNHTTWNTIHTLQWWFYAMDFISPREIFRIGISRLFLKKRNGIQTEFGVLALWLWIQAYSWHLAIPSNALANAYAKNPYNKKMQPSCASDVNLCEASNVT